MLFSRNVFAYSFFCILIFVFNVHSMKKKMARQDYNYCNYLIFSIIFKIQNFLEKCKLKLRLDKSNDMVLYTNFKENFDFQSLGEQIEQI